MHIHKDLIGTREITLSDTQNQPDDCGISIPNFVINTILQINFTKTVTIMWAITEQEVVHSCDQIMAPKYIPCNFHLTWKRYV